MRNHRHYQLGNAECFKRILLFFLIGFFIGGIFYYLFQASFENLEQNLTIWSRTEQTVIPLLRSFWQHGKYLLLLWVFSMNSLSWLYQKGFTIYTGIRNGFLLMFFIYSKGIFGIIIYLISLLPHGILFMLLYLYLFLLQSQNRQSKQRATRWILVLLVFITACVLEVKINLVWMEAILK